MAEMQFELKGWKALWALPVVLVIMFVMYQARSDTLETDAKEQLHLWIASHYSRIALKDLEDAGGIHQADEETIQSLVDSGNVEIVGIEKRGMGSEIVVRAQVRVNGELPPDGKEYHYYRMKHGAITGWMVDYETTKWSYLLTW